MPECVLVPLGGHYCPEVTVEYDEMTGRLVVTNDLRRFLSSTIMRNGCYAIDGAMQFLVKFYADAANVEAECQVYWLWTDDPFKPEKVRVFFYEEDDTVPAGDSWVTVASLAQTWADDYLTYSDELEGADPGMRVGLITKRIFGPLAPWASTSARTLPLMGWSDDEDPREIMLGWQFVFDDNSVLYVTPFSVTLERPEEAVRPIPLPSLDQLERPLHLN